MNHEELLNHLSDLGACDDAQLWVEDKLWVKYLEDRED